MMALATVPVTAQEAGGEALPLKNIKVTIRYDTTDPDGKREVKTREVVAQEGSRASLLIGSRVPIAMTETAGGDESQDGPITSYSYQNIGFAAELRAWVLPGGKIAVEAEIESSQIAPDSSTDLHPVILTYQQRIQVVVENGKPMHVTRVEDPDRVNGHFEIIAEIVE
jgi:hypothetical protein